jgi:purine nucleosidase
MAYPAARCRAKPTHAVDAIIETIRSHPGIVVVTLGPLTNVALAVSREPGIVADVSRCVIMAGNPCCEGNVTPAAEYNVWVDPEAAGIVMRAGLPLEMVGWHLSRGEAVLDAKDIEHVLGIGTPAARFAIECNGRAKDGYYRQTGEIGISLPDPVAMSVALEASICTGASAHYVDVEVSSELTRGMTVVDRLNVSGDARNLAVWKPLLDRVPKTTVCWSIDTLRWKQSLYTALML